MSNERAWWGHPLGMPSPYHDDVQHASLGRKPWNHGEVQKIYDETIKKKF